MRTSRPVLAAAAAATLTFVLAACGDSTDETADPGAESPAAAEEVDATHNEADVTFAQGMIPHHRQAVQMSELAAGRTENPEALELAEEISAAQGPEIQTMTAFLEAWGADVPADDMTMDGDGMDGDGMDGMAGMAGMMTPEEMADLEAAEGQSFDQMFLQMMVAHHEGAVEMAQTELDEGQDPDALQLAEEIIDTQQSEIQRMQNLLETP